MHRDTTNELYFRVLTCEYIYEIRLLSPFFLLLSYFQLNTNTFCRITIWCNERQNAGEPPTPMLLLCQTSDPVRALILSQSTELKSELFDDRSNLL